MARRISTKKRFPLKDLKYNSILVSLFINRILQKGKKRLALSILYNALNIIEEKTAKNPLLILEIAVRNCSPYVQLKSKRIGGATHQVPLLLSNFQSIKLAIRWIVQFSRKRAGKKISIKLANELLDASKGIGNVIKKKEETHKMAEANKTFFQVQ